MPPAIVDFDLCSKSSALQCAPFEFSDCAGYDGKFSLSHGTRFKKGPALEACKLEHRTFVRVMLGFGRRNSSKELQTVVHPKKIVESAVLIWLPHCVTGRRGRESAESM